MAIRKKPAEIKAELTANIEKWQNRAAEVLVILLLCVQPLYLSSDRYIRLTWHKYRFFVFVMVLACIAAVSILLVKRLKSVDSPKVKLTLVDWAALVFAAVTLISALLSPYQGYPNVMYTLNGSGPVFVNVWNGLAERYDGAVTQLFYIAAFWIISRWYKPRERDFVIFGFSALTVSLIGILQFYGMDFLKLWPHHIEQYAHLTSYEYFFRSTLGNINIVSTYVCVAVLLSGFLFIRSGSKWRPLYLAASVLVFWLMVLASSFSGMVGTLAAVFFALPFIVESRRHLGSFLLLGSGWAGAFTLQRLLYNYAVLKTESPGRLALYAGTTALLLAGGLLLTTVWKGKRYEPDPGAPVRWKLGVILIAAALCIGLIGVEALGRRGEGGPDSHKDILYQSREILHGNIADEFGSNRFFIWRVSLEAFPNHPSPFVGALIGSGPDTFGQTFPKEAQYFYDEPYDKAHNEYIQILICQGLLGLLAYLAFLGLLLVRNIPRAFKNPLLTAVLAAFFGYCVQAFFNISLPIVSQMLWVLAGMLACRNGFSGAAETQREG
jgi:hypothetical protein